MTIVRLIRSLDDLTKAEITKVLAEVTGNMARPANKAEGMRRFQNICAERGLDEAAALAEAGFVVETYTPAEGARKGSGVLTEDEVAEARVEGFLDAVSEPLTGQARTSGDETVRILITSDSLLADVQVHGAFSKEADAFERAETLNVEDPRRIFFHRQSGDGQFVVLSGKLVEPAPMRPKRARVARAEGEARPVQPGTKIAQVVELLKRSGGATAEEVCKATGWVADTARSTWTCRATTASALPRQKSPAVPPATRSSNRRRPERCFLLGSLSGPV